MGMTIEKMYGSYSDADLNDWERFPMNASVLTSYAFGAWLFRRDERRDTKIKADYENRLKADMVAMLEDLKLDMEAKENYYEQAFKEPSNAVHEAAMGGRMFGCGECKEVIQQKINKLKGEETDGKR